MEPNDLLSDPILGCETPTGFERLDLPGLLCGLGEDRVLSLPALQRHQADAVHIFLCYLAAAVLVRQAESAPAQNAQFWRQGLRDCLDEIERLGS